MMPLSAAIFVSLAAQQLTPAQVGRFGTVGRSLSEEEILQIRDLGNAAGEPPWLNLGFGSLIWGVERVTDYLERTVTTERLQRGRTETGVTALRMIQRPSEGNGCARGTIRRLGSSATPTALRIGWQRTPCRRLLLLSVARHHPVRRAYRR